MARCPARDSLAWLRGNITIAGGGLAGLSLGIALRNRGVPVSVIEAGRYPRHRVCGEFISGVSGETLDFLGISGCFHDALRHRSLAWHDRGHLLLTDELPAPALGISRHRLDLRLRDCFLALGGALATGMRARPDPAEGLVWAAGRRNAKGRWIGLKTHVRMPTRTDLEMHSGSNGYAGLAGVEEGWTNVCGLFLLEKGIAATGSGLLPAYLEAGGNHDLAERLRSSEWREGSLSAVAGFETGRQPEMPGLLRVGDAAEMIPPFTGNGMTMAFESARLAVEPLVSWSGGACSWERAREAIRVAALRCFRRRMWSASLAHPLLFRSGGRAVIRSLAATGVFPFRPLLSLVR
jgi:menaquinone-9 beta-reductase